MFRTFPWYVPLSGNPADASSQNRAPKPYRAKSASGTIFTLLIACAPASGYAPHAT